MAKAANAVVKEKEMAGKKDLDLREEVPGERTGSKFTYLL